MSYTFIGQTLTNTQLCTIYHNMQNRCYSEATHRNQPYYEDCTIAPIWYDPDAEKFKRQAKDPCRHAFYEWVRQHYYKMDSGEAVELDKDILVKGNRLYSPDTCLFVPQKVNAFFGGISRKAAPSAQELAYWEGRRDQLLQCYYGEIPQEVYEAIKNYEF